MFFFSEYSITLAMEIREYCPFKPRINDESNCINICAISLRSAQNCFRSILIKSILFILVIIWHIDSEIL